jgi:hypothetical protein
MKIRAWIVAAAIAAASGFATAQTAQACVINPDGECMTSVVRHQPSQPSTGHTHKKPAKPVAHKKRHSASKPAEVQPLPWDGPEGTQQPTLYDPTQNQYDPYQYQDIFGQVKQPTQGR